MSDRKLPNVQEGGMAPMSFTLSAKEMEALIKAMKKRVRVQTTPGGDLDSSRAAAAITPRRGGARFKAPAFAGSDLVEQLLASARKSRDEARVIAQQLLDRGAIQDAAVGHGAAGGSGLALIRRRSLMRDGPVPPPSPSPSPKPLEEEPSATFSESRLYTPQVFAELSERQAVMLASALHDGLPQGALAFTGVAAVDFWTRSAKSYAPSRQAAVAVGQELLNKGFIDPAPGSTRTEFRDSKDLFTFRETPNRLWGFLLKRGRVAVGWKVRWFLVKDQKEKKALYFKSPKSPKPQAQIAFENSVIRLSSDTELSFEVVTPTRVWYVQAFSEQSLVDWVEALQPMASEVAHENSLIEEAERAIESAEADSNRLFLLQESAAQEQLQEEREFVQQSSSQQSTAVTPDLIDVVPAPRGHLKQQPHHVRSESTTGDDRPPRAPSAGLTEEEEPRSRGNSAADIPVVITDAADEEEKAGETEPIEPSPIEDALQCILHVVVVGRVSSTLVTSTGQVWIGCDSGDVFVTKIDAQKPEDGQPAAIAVDPLIAAPLELQPVAVPPMHWSPVVSLVQVGGEEGATAVWSGDENGEVTLWEGTTFSAFRTFTQRRGARAVIASGRPSRHRVFCAGSTAGTIDSWRTDDTGLDAEFLETIAIPGCSAPVSRIEVTADGVVWAATGSLDLFAYDPATRTTRRLSLSVSPPAPGPSALTCLRAAGPRRLWTGHLAGDLCMVELADDRARLEVQAVIRRGAISVPVESAAVSYAGTLWTSMPMPPPPFNASARAGGGSSKVVEWTCQMLPRRALTLMHKVCLVACSSRGDFLALATTLGHVMVFHLVSPPPFATL